MKKQENKRRSTTHNKYLTSSSYKIAAIGIFLAMFISVLPINVVLSAGTISGTVYIDYNMNGVRDTSGTAPNLAIDNGFGEIGGQKVKVTAYDSSGTQRGTADVNADGTYSFTTTGTGPYRVEFTNVTGGYSPSSVGTDNDSAVQFVNEGGASNVDLGIISSKEYCQDNPLLSTTCFINGDNTTSADALVALNYDRTGSVQHIGFTDEIGSTWGLAWKKNSKKLLVSSILKRHSGFGSGKDGILGNADDMRTIYVYDYSNPSPTNGAGTIVTAEAIDLGSFSGVNLGANPRFGSSPANDLGVITAPSRDYGVFDKVGKVGIGGIALSEDENTLYVVNINSAQPQLISLDVSDLTNVSLNSIVNITDPGCPGTDSAAPWAVRVNQGNVYVGTVCTADNSQSFANLRAYLLKLNGNSFTTVDLDSTTANDYILLNYDRTFGYASNGGGGNGRAEWRPWLASFPTNLSSTYDKTYATPIFSDMNFHSDGALSIGLMDRSGHQIGYGNYSEDQNSTTLYDYISSGDALKICNSGTGFIPEGKTGCAQPTGGIYDRPDGSAGTPTEIDGIPNEFYNDSSLTGGAGSGGHLETFFGGIGAIPGVNELAIVQMNPGPTVHAGGLRWVSTANGSVIDNFTLYQNPNSTNTNATLGKSNGLGDIEMLCDAAPLQVGNRIWNDADGDGIQDPNESPIGNVEVEIWADTTGNGTPDTQVGTATTDANGNYIFGGTTDTNLLPDPSCSGTSTTTVNSTVNASTDDGYEKSNGKIDNGGINRLTNGFMTIGEDGYAGVRFTNISVPQGATITNAYIQFTANNDVSANTGTVTSTIRGEDANNAATFVATDNNINGRPDTSAANNVSWSIPAWSTANESGANQRTPDLTAIVKEIVDRPGWLSGNAMVFTLQNTIGVRNAESFDGSSANAPRLVVEYSSAANCPYKVNPNTAYEVRIPTSNYSGALSGFTPTLPNSDASANGDSRDSDGIILAGNQVIAPFTTGANSQNNHSYDFGFRAGAATYSVGNRLWYDTDNDGIIDSGEVGISGVSVSIFTADGSGQPTGAAISTITTDANGYYRFDGLAADDYVIRVNPTNFGGGNVLGGYQNTANAATPTDDGVESSGAASNGDNGIDVASPATAGSVRTDGVLSNSFTLGGVLEPLNELDVPSSGTYAGQGSLDDRADMTVDFGFYKLTLSGTAWSDTGIGLIGQVPNNGQLDANENRLVGYRTKLYDSAGNEIPVGPDGVLGTADDAPGGMLTNGTGDYNFMGLPAGDYRVVITSNGGQSSNSGDSNEETDPNLNGDSNDNGFPDNTGNYPNMIISGIVTLTPGSSGAQSNNAVTNNDGQTANPTVDFGLVLAPTMVKLDDFNAYFDGGNVVVEWSTGDEARNLGFNVYRETNGQKELITNAPIAGSALKTNINMQVKGDSYRWIDKESKLGGIYYLEDLDMDGTSTMHGPIQPNVKFGYSSYNSDSSKLLSDLVQPLARSTQKEFVIEKVNSDADMRSADVSSVFEKQREIAAMKGVKIFVKDAGLYQFNMEQLARLGFDVDSDKNLWQLFANGSEVPMSIRQDRRSGEYKLEFYGKGFESNIANEQVYYLIKGKQAGLRLPEAKYNQVQGEVDATGYDVTVERKDRSIYISSILNGDYENWFGSVIAPNTETLQDLRLVNPVSDGFTDARLRIRMQGLSNASHTVNITFNGLQLGTVDFASTQNEEFEVDVPMSSIIDGINQVGLQSVGAGSDYSLVDAVSVRYTRRFVAENNLLRFSVPAYQTARIGGFSKDDIRVVEIDNDVAIREVSVEGEKVNGTAGFSLESAGYDREFIAISDNSYTRNIARTEINTVSKLYSSKNEADFIIVAPTQFGKEASELRRRRTAQGWKTKVVYVEDIYDEYSFGIRSSVAIKNFLRDASSVWEDQAEYVLLFGDSSFDSKNYLNQIDRDLIPTKLIDTEFMETSSDTWLADFDNDGVEDLALGRLPMGDRSEARQMLAKLLRYDQQATREIDSNLLIADNFFNSYNDILEDRLPSGAVATRLNRSEMSDGQLRSEIISKMQDSPMVVTYTGHGSTGTWASSSVLRTSDVANFSNDKLSFFMLMTCLNGFTHSPYSDSLSEAFVKAENGAIAAWASSGSTYANGQIFMSQRATSDLFNLSRNPLPIGDLTRVAKQTTTDMDARRTWQLIGDPTIVIK